MRSSRLKHRIDIMQNTLTTDSMGGDTSAWTIYLSRWCEFVRRSQKELDQADQVMNLTEVMIRTRYHAGVTETMRIHFRDEVFEIVSLINVKEKNKELEINVKKLILDEDVAV